MKVMISVVCGLLALSAVCGDKIDLIKVGGVGKVAFVNTCNASTNELSTVMKSVGGLLRIEYEIKNGSWSLPEAKKCFEATGAQAAVFLISEKGFPMSLIAMEDKWGVVNVDGLDDACISKEALRVFTVILGGASSRYEASTMRPVFNKDDLAKKAGRVVTFDSIIAISNYLPEMGIKPYEMMAREDAVEEGLVKDEKPAAKK